MLKPGRISIPRLSLLVTPSAPSNLQDSQQFSELSLSVSFYLLSHGYHSTIFDYVSIITITYMVGLGQASVEEAAVALKGGLCRIYSCVRP